MLFSPTISNRSAEVQNDHHTAVPLTDVDSDAATGQRLPPQRTDVICYASDPGRLLDAETTTAYCEMAPMRHSQSLKRSYGCAVMLKVLSLFLVLFLLQCGHASRLRRSPLRELSTEGPSFVQLGNAQVAAPLTATSHRPTQFQQDQQASLGGIQSDMRKVAYGAGAGTGAYIGVSAAGVAGTPAIGGGAGLVGLAIGGLYGLGMTHARMGSSSRTANQRQTYGTDQRNSGFSTLLIFAMVVCVIALLVALALATHKGMKRDEERVPQYKLDAQQALKEQRERSWSSQQQIY
eukprot:Lankesteria_metandrocarpae@DN2913_c0_g1_i1.p1